MREKREFKKSYHLPAETLYSSEKFMQQEIANNMAWFAKDVLDIDLKTFQRESSMPITSDYISKVSRGRRITLSRGTPKVDFMLESKAGNLTAIECKNPRSEKELVSAISQIMAYSAIASHQEGKLSRLVIVTSKYYDLAGKVIKKFKLPIEMIVFSKKFVATMK